MVASSGQFLQQAFGLLEIGGVKPLGEPAVDFRQQLAGLGALALALPQARATRRCPQLQRFGLLAAGDVQGLLETGVRLLLVRDGLPQQQLPVSRCTSASQNRAPV